MALTGHRGRSKLKLATLLLIQRIYMECKASIINNAWVAKQLKMNGQSMRLKPNNYCHQIVLTALDFENISHLSECHPIN